MILFTPTLDKLITLYPTAKIDIVVTQAGALAPIRHREDIHRQETISLSPKRLLPSAMKLRKRKYDLSIVTSGGKPWKAMLFSFAVGAPRRVGEVLNDSFNLYTHPVKRGNSVHRKISNFELLAPLTDISGETIPSVSFTLPKELEEYGETFIKKNSIRGPIMGIHPGSNREFAFRRWPKEFYAELVAKINQFYPKINILLFVGPDELEEGDYISENSDCTVVKEPSLDSVAAVVMNCDIFFNSDSGLGHIAACNPDCRIFSIFGPADERLTGPGSDNCTIIKKNLPCQPCNPENRKITLSCKLECLKTLTPDEVFSRMESSLKEITEK